MQIPYRHLTKDLLKKVPGAGPRHPSEAPSQSHGDAYTENLSDGGLFVSTGNPLEQGEQFLLTLQLPDLPAPMKIKCEVVWARAEGEETDSPNGMGVKFIEITQEDKETLKKYLNL
jgi:uncharacterized protein (TIGR02266 family)